jgi:antitoxin FitA
LNLRAFLGVFRFAKMPVRRTHAISPRGEAAIYPDRRSTPVISLFKKSMLRQEVGPNLRKRGKTRGSAHLVMAGLVPAIPITGHCAILIEIAGTSPAMTPRVLLLLRNLPRAIALTNMIAMIAGVAMASITIRNLDDALKRKLRLRAAHRNRSMEDEARDILRTALAQEPAETQNLADAIRELVEPLGGVELELPPRGPMTEPPNFK